MRNLPQDKLIILFDGVCNLCNDSIHKVIRLDHKNRFVFTALQSEIGQEIVNYLKIDPKSTDSVILYNPGHSYFIKSTAILEISKNFGGAWWLFQVFYLVPEVFRNWVYDYIAKHRYRWFGKKEYCMIPTPELEEKFLNK